MSSSFTNKVCLITGGARGIGKAITSELLRNGARCLFVDISYQGGLETEAELREQFGSDRVSFLRVDVTSETNLRQAFMKCIEDFGTLDVVVNNAGIVSEHAWESVNQVNFVAGEKYMRDLPYDHLMLSATDVGEAAVDIIDKGRTGSVWFIQNHGEPAYEIKDQNTMENLLVQKPMSNQTRNPSILSEA